MIFRRIIKPLLFSLPIEQAHRLSLLALRLMGWLPGGRWLLRRSWAVESPELGREVFGLHFKNPVGMAAGFDVNGDVFRELATLGFGFVEIGTVTPRPQAGNPRPRVFRLAKDGATVNRMGFPNAGLEYALNRLRGDHHGVIVGCNIGCNNDTPYDKVPQDYLKVFRNLYQYTDYFTININCDNASEESTAPSTERLMQILEPLFDFRRGQNQYRPILLKISPDLTNDEVDRMADVMIDTPLDGIVAVSGTNHREGLKTRATSLNRMGSGRLGGDPLKQRALEVVRRVYARAKGTYPIIGVGGIGSAANVREMLEAGASLVQLYTSMIYQGPGVAGQICRELLPSPAGEGPVPESGHETSAENKREVAEPASSNEAEEPQKVFSVESEERAPVETEATEKA